MRSPLAAAGLAVALLVVLRPAGAAVTLVVDRPIQPGARLTRPDIEPFGNKLPFKFYRCTMEFIFRDSLKRVYTGTTGEHACVAKVGARAYDETGRAFGTAVFQECAPSAGPLKPILAVVQECAPGAGSFTLIRIDQARYRDVSPSVRHWGGPTGIMSVSQAKRGALVLFTGSAFVLGDLKQTAPRLGVLMSYDAAHYTAETLAQLGDSGGPIIDRATGRAVGMISDYGLSDRPPVTDDGPTIARILADVAKHGFKLTLVTAPYTAP